MKIIDNRKDIFYPQQDNLPRSVYAIISGISGNVVTVVSCRDPEDILKILIEEHVPIDLDKAVAKHIGTTALEIGVIKI